MRNQRAVCERRQLQCPPRYNKRGKSSPSNPSQNSFMQQSERKPSRTRSPRGRSPSGRMSRWPCKDYLKGTCNNSSCKKWHPPEYLFYKIKSGCRFGEKCSYAHRQVDEQSTERFKKEWSQKSSSHIKEGWLAWKRMATFLNSDKNHKRDRGDPMSSVTPVMSWNEDLSVVDHRTHDNWVAPFKTWSRRSLSYGRALTCRSQSNVWNSRRLLRDTLKFETKILRSDIFAQVSLMSVAPTPQNLRIVHAKRQSGKS